MNANEKILTAHNYITMRDTLDELEDMTIMLQMMASAIKAGELDTDHYARALDRMAGMMTDKLLTIDEALTSAEAQQDAPATNWCADLDRIPGKAQRAKK